MNKPELDTTHHLIFEAGEWITPHFMVFKVGTCTGQWRCNGKSYDILSIKNEESGNGHLQDVFEWFEHSCKRDRKNLLILEVFNEDFKRHLLKKRGFSVKSEKSLIKRWKEMK